MSEMQTISQTETNTITQELDDNVFVVEAPLFILFAEYLGYVSIFNKFAEDWCDGKVPDECIQKIIIIEAKSIFRQMKEDYEIEDIRDFYSMYYPILFEEYDDKLKKLLTKK